MARVYVLSGPDLGKSFEVASGAVLGRANECAVVLRDHSVSRQHARLECTGGQWAVVDLGSRNGLVVRGAKAARAELGDGMEFQLGEVLLRFRAQVPAAEASAPPPAAPARPVPAPAPVAEDEITLEGDWDAAAPAPAPAAPVPVPVPAPAPAAPARAHVAPRTEPAAPARVEPRSPPVARPAPAGGLEHKDRGVLQFHKQTDQRGLFQSDLAQQPWYVKLAVWIAALLLFALVGWGAFRATGFFKQKVAGEPAELEPR